MTIFSDIREALSKFLRSTSSYEASVNEFIRDLQRILIRGDVNVKLVFQLSQRIKERALKEQPPPGVSRRDWFVKIVYEELVNLLGGEEEPQIEPPKKPWTIMMVGVQGSGKTTTCGKLARFYKKRGYRVGLVCADTYRPAAYEQLRQLAEQVGVEFYGEKDSKDPIGIAQRGVKELLERGCDIIIVDTAGRHKEEHGLLEEMKQIASKISPDEVMLVIDATMGQQAYSMAKAFHDAVPVGSIIITKLDGSAKGGGALSAVAATGAKVKFVGTGEKLDEFEVFSPKRFVSRLLGLGDLESLLERVKEAEIAEDVAKRAEAIMSGKITMRDLYHQLEALRKLGPLSKVLQMIPGLGLSLPGEEELRITEEKMRKWMVIINSMSYEELDKPEHIPRKRIKEIAIGAGVRPEDVKELLTYYKNIKTLSKKLKRQKALLKRLGLRQL